MTWPTALYVVVSALLASVRALFWFAVTVAVASCEVAPLPDAVALLVIEPASRSAWVIVWVAVQYLHAARPICPLPHGSIAPSLSSLSENGPASVTLPEFLIE